MPYPNCQWKAEVRDSELDLQGIVNNAVYCVYMEHCRHKLLKTLGLDFSQLHRQGYDLVARECTIRFIHPLISGDEFTVTAEFEPANKAKCFVKQKIFREPDKKEIIKAVYTIVGIDRNKNQLSLPKQLVDLLSSTQNTSRT